MKYRILGELVEVTNSKGHTSKWDRGSEITDMQVTDAQASELIDKGQIEVIVE